MLPELQSKVAQAAKLAASGQTAQARALLLELIDDVPGYADAWWGLAKVARDNAERRMALQQLLRLDPSHVQGREMLARLDAQPTHTERKTRSWLTGTGIAVALLFVALVIALVALLVVRNTVNQVAIAPTSSGLVALASETTPPTLAIGTATPLPTVTHSPTPFPSATLPPTATATRTPAPTQTPTAQPSSTPTPQPTATTTPTRTPQPSATLTPVPTQSPSPTPQPSSTSTARPTATATLTRTPQPSPTVTPMPTQTTSPTPQPTATPTRTPQPSPTLTPVPTQTPSPTHTFTPTVTSSPTATPSFEDLSADYALALTQQAAVADWIDTEYPAISAANAAQLASVGGLANVQTYGAHWAIAPLVTAPFPIAIEWLRADENSVRATALYLWNIQTGATLGRILGDNILDCFTRDATQPGFVCPAADGVTVLSSDLQRSPVLPFTEQALEGRQTWISPDGTLLAVEKVDASNQVDGLLVFDLVTGRERARIAAPEPRWSGIVAYSSDSSMLFVGGRGNIYAYSTMDGSSLPTLDGWTASSDILFNITSLGSDVGGDARLFVDTSSRTGVLRLNSNGTYQLFPLPAANQMSVFATNAAHTLLVGGQVIADGQWALTFYDLISERITAQLTVNINDLRWMTFIADDRILMLGGVYDADLPYIQYYAVAS
ncbi:MAG: hypothetical protein SF123_15055 [Chloroflexota bacterium]|nr:hypothetical protein [Chloroflexota bacterium]